MSNTTNTVKIIVDRSKLSAWPPGKIVDWVIKTEDLTWSADKIEVKVQVVIGNKQYATGRRLTLYMLPNLPV